VLGNSRTADGSRFRIVVLAVKRHADLQNYREGTRFSQLPSAIPQSEQVTVALRDPDAEVK
jgi:hypothetical protein